ncbi:MAG: 4Fe-4S binding protein, partial [Firmicutes bacterium]|nr:4Fe-4S binding protein [Bacillota bacterium]
VVDNLARVDYDKCTNCGKCVEVCPVNVIVKQGKSIVIREGQDASLIQ